MAKDQTEEKKCENGCDESHVCSKCVCKRCKTMNLETMECDCPSSTLDGIVIETAERIVIDYANCSGRETENRSAFRGMVIGHLNSLLSKRDAEIREMLEQYLLIKCECENADCPNCMRLYVVLAKLDNQSK